MSHPLRFWKMSGAGNDFIVADGRAGLDLDTGALAAKLCARGTSVGADGLLVVEGVEANRASIEFRNSDGSRAEFCGNGARCVARFIVEQGILRGPRFVLRFPGAEAEARVDADGTSVLLAPPDTPERVSSLRRFEGGEVEFWSTRAGVPHLLALSGRAAGEELDRVEPLLRQYSPEFLEKFNLSALRFIDESTLEIATLERGAARTLACGSAAVAAADLAMRSRGGRSWSVIPPSGSPLSVEFSGEGALLGGEARLVYRGEVEL